MVTFVRTRVWPDVVPMIEQLEPRLLLSGSNPVTQLPLPCRMGETFLLEDYDNKVTQNDMGFNYFMGNAGAVESAEGITAVDLSAVSNGSTGGSLSVAFDFTGQSPEEDHFAGLFHSLFGLTDTLVSLTGDGVQPPEPTSFPDYFLDSQDIFRGLYGYEDRSVDTLRFDIRLESSHDVNLKIELKDEDDVDVYTRCLLLGGGWTPFSLRLPTHSLPTHFTQSTIPGGVAAFNWCELSTLAFIVERRNVGDGITNPESGQFLLDNIRLVDEDGLYPDYDAMCEPGTGALRSEYHEAFLDQARGLSFQYFRDFASTDLRTGGIIQDRSTFADLMTVGGAGFQLSAYVVGAERGYISRTEAATRTRDILKVLHDQPIGPDRVGMIGNRGFFYHFLGIDGLRKQNFDFEETPIDESKNTVEVSVIDTALLLCGALTSAQYFTGGDAAEVEIRSLAQAIYERVDWPFMFNGSLSQFYLGWKPNEDRYDDDTHGRFLIDDAYGEGQYSSKWDGSQEVPATLDYYTDEALLVALLAIASPTHPVPSDAWYGLIRDFDGGAFAKTYPGALFTYQFASVWLDTDALGTDNGTSSIDYFENTRASIDATRQYCISNPLGRTTWQDGRGEWLWGLSACEGPFDQYFAHAAPPAALALVRPVPGHSYEGEDGTGDGSVMPRSNASGQHTVWLHAGESRDLTVEVSSDVAASFEVRYSNDNSGPLETIDVSVDGMTVGSFEAQDTGDYGAGWNVFESSGVIGNARLAAGSHTVRLSVTGGDGYGVEIDKLDLSLDLPLETGTVTAYAVASAIPHIPDIGTESLWRIAREDLNADGSFELLHPRFGFADAFNFDVVPAAVLAAPDAKRSSGPWVQLTGFSIDHGPLLLLIDNYLGDTYNGLVKEMLVPDLFMSDPCISSTLASLFPAWPSATVVDRHIFYNDSYFDGDDPAANVTDDNAIAADKTALLPGETATFANYTSYSRGINGIMIDVAGLAGMPSTTDFVFKAGNSDVPSVWVVAPAPASITVRSGEGGGGSDRVTIIWADNNLDDVVDPNEAVANQWLQVTLLSDTNGGNLGLADDEIFYFSDLPGEVNGNGTVGAADYIALKQAFGSSVTEPGGPADFDCSGAVDREDLMALQGSIGQSINMAFSAPEQATVPAGAVAEPEPIAPSVDEPAADATMTVGLPVEVSAASSTLQATAGILDALAHSGPPRLATTPSTSRPSHTELPILLAVRIGPMPTFPSRLLRADTADPVVSDVLQLAAPWWSGDLARRELPDEPWMTSLTVDIAGKPRKGRLDPIGLDVLAVSR